MDAAKSVEELRPGLLFQEEQMMQKALSQEWWTGLRKHWVAYVNEATHTPSQFALALQLLDKNIAFHATYDTVRFFVHPRLLVLVLFLFLYLG